LSFALLLFGHKLAGTGCCQSRSYCGLSVFDGLGEILGLSEAPPNSPPSISSMDMSSAAFFAFIDRRTGFGPLRQRLFKELADRLSMTPMCRGHFHGCGLSGADGKGLKASRPFSPARR
jgi:hypothetical protein